MRWSNAELARIAAPVAFLLAVTIAVLLVRSGLDAGTTPAPANLPRAGQSSAERFVVVRSGDTLQAIATRSHLELATVRDLNPGIDPVELRVGQRIRVR